MTKTLETIGITNQDNEQPEMTLTTVDQTAVATAELAAVRWQKAFSCHGTTINEDHEESQLNRNSVNQPLVYQFLQNKKIGRAHV